MLKEAVIIAATMVLIEPGSCSTIRQHIDTPAQCDDAQGECVDQKQGENQ